MSKHRPLILAAIAALALAAPASAQSDAAAEFLEQCRGDRDDDRERVCEVRPVEVSTRGRLAIDAAPNGGIHVEGAGRGAIEVSAFVQVHARTEARAREIARQVRVVDDGGRIRTDGPSTGRGEGWSVGFHALVPRETDLDLQSSNGGIKVAGVRGRIDAETVNGGVAFSALAGDVRGRTTNGGVKVELTGERWDGAGLDLRTTNGGVVVRVPESYSAELEAGTVNGSLHTELPLRVTGNISRSISAQLGSGGAPVRVRTTNGSVKLTGD